MSEFDSAVIYERFGNGYIIYASTTTTDSCFEFRISIHGKCKSVVIFKACGHICGHKMVSSYFFLIFSHSVLTIVNWHQGSVVTFVVTKFWWRNADRPAKFWSKCFIPWGFLIEGGMYYNHHDDWFWLYNAYHGSLWPTMVTSMSRFARLYDPSPLLNIRLSSSIMHDHFGSLVILSLIPI